MWKKWVLIAFLGLAASSVSGCKSTSAGPVEPPPPDRPPVGEE
jgi:hypothetical protein